MLKKIILVVVWKIMCVCVCVLIHLVMTNSLRRHDQLTATPWTVARQAPLSIGFSRQDYWNERPFPSPWDLPDPGM